MSIMRDPQESIKKQGRRQDTGQESGNGANDDGDRGHRLQRRGNESGNKGEEAITVFEANRKQKLQVTNHNRNNQYNQNSNSMVQKSKLDWMLEDATRSFTLTERAKAEIVQRQLVQFSEILKIKLRNRVFKYKLEAKAIWAHLVENGAQFFVPDEVHNVNWEFQDPGQGGGGAGGMTSPVGGVNQGYTGSSFQSSQGSSLTGLSNISSLLQFMLPQSITGRLGFGLVSVLSFGVLYRKLVQDIRPFAFGFVGLSVYRNTLLKMKANELCRCLNVALSFEQEDELETERVIRELAEQLAVRHINHVSKLSKNGHRTLATVMVDRIVRHLEKHRFGYEGESLIWYVSEYQQLKWKMKAFWQRLVLPADRIPSDSRPKLSLHDRCVRALAVEVMDYDDRALELEPYHKEESENPNRKRIWTASRVLSQAAVYVMEHDQLYVHSQTSMELPFLYGTEKEVRWRKLHRYEIQSQNDDNDDIRLINNSIGQEEDHVRSKL